MIINMGLMNLLSIIDSIKFNDINKIKKKCFNKKK